MVIDIFVNFNTELYINGTKITNRKLIALNYWKKYFWFDLISLLGLIFNIYLLFFFKIMTIGKIIDKLELYVILNQNLHATFSLAVLITKTIFMTHMFAWYIIL